jgi:AraC-like DNA-binding protein
MDLSPGYREMPPPPAVHGLVACLWVRVCGDADEVRILPDACADVVWRQGEGTTLAGPDTAARLVSPAPGEVLVGMRFLPGAAGGALGAPVDELRDVHVDVGEVDRAFDVDGELAPDDVAARFVSAAAGRRPDPIVVEAARRLSRQSIGTLADDLAISERQLRRRFQAAVGYGPKTLARVLRFRRFVDAIDRGDTNLARLALDAGYADQAHMTAEVTQLAGLSPVRFLKDRTLTAA